MIASDHDILNGCGNSQPKGRFLNIAMFQKPHEFTLGNLASFAAMLFDQGFSVCVNVAHGARIAPPHKPRKWLFGETGKQGLDSHSYSEASEYNRINEVPDMAERWPDHPTELKQDKHY